MQSRNNSLIDLIALVYRWRKQIIIATLISSVIAAGLSLTLDNYYEASTQFYAASPELAQPSPIGNLPDEKKIYGNDNDIDRLISITKSNIIQDFLIDSFDLYNHYEIDSAKAKAKYKLLLKLNKLFDVSKTKYDAIKLSIEDKDAELSAAMANATRNKVNYLASQLIKKSQADLLSGYEESVKSKQEQYDAIADSLYSARVKYNIFNTQSQGEAFGSSIVELQGNIQNYNARVKVLKNNPSVPSDSLAIVEAKLEGFRQQYRNLNSSIKDYNEGYPSILKFERELKDFGDQLNLDKERLKQLKAAYEMDVKAIHVVENAEKPVIKSRPKRSYIVIGVALLTFFLSSLWVIIQDEMNRNNWRSKFKGE